MAQTSGMYIIVFMVGLLKMYFRKSTSISGWELKTLSAYFTLSSSVNSMISMCLLTWGQHNLNYILAEGQLDITTVTFGRHEPDISCLIKQLSSFRRVEGNSPKPSETSNTPSPSKIPSTTARPSIGSVGWCNSSERLSQVCTRFSRNFKSTTREYCCIVSSSSHLWHSSHANVLLPMPGGPSTSMHFRGDLLLETNTSSRCTCPFRQRIWSTPPWRVALVNSLASSRQTCLFVMIARLI